MATKHQYAPTKTNLNKLKDELKFAKQGYELLDQKRTILIMELMRLIDQATEFEERADALLASAYKALRDSVVANGRLNAYAQALTVNIESEIVVDNRRIMGVSIPAVTTHFVDHPPYYSGYGAGSALDEAVIAFKQAVQLMGRLAELKIGIMRLAHEVKRTIRKVNALDRIAIPSAQGQIRVIESHLEESERDMFVLMKSVKQHLQKRQ
ncbi:V-type ATP synthase subunit D [Entomospira culicis]|uniref:V-type ATP synthase subunit D n=1 Tax=Entomospira culicis TaxID=2719989 RepID=A0A968GDK2_9SPIO|nr:V-type ATP synthase subunit D [Entomospira culicis]NIZ18435.1 V-type ATP synthase subunit D [Entomospira culicis]NIZ68651.1 V-type ATP synthase subunit D [Entomospira culicis]WDI37250.1 V-type ATP synthase subunit D [Entomospira culicis]WDI38879.1 V-type ATP synthase subunit D [Entomospira culicis]